MPVTRDATVGLIGRRLAGPWQRYAPRQWFSRHFPGCRNAQVSCGALRPEMRPALRSRRPVTGVNTNHPNISAYGGPSAVRRVRDARRSPALATAVTAMLLVASSCSGDNDAVGTATTEATSQPIATSTTADPTPTSATPVTSSTAVAPPSSSAPATSTTAPPTPVLGEVESAVADAYRASFDAWTRCLGELPDCDLDAMVEHLTGDYRLLSWEQALRYAEAGQTVSELESRVLTIESVSIDGSGTQATVISCEVDASVRYHSSGGVINDDFGSLRRASILLLEDGQWRITGFENLEAATGEEANICVG